MAVTKETKTKKEKKERTFNSDRVARQVKASLKAVFPKDNDKFIVSSFVERVEVLYFENITTTASELNMFCSIFCNLGKIKREQILFSKIKKEPIAAPAPVATPAATK